MRRPPGATTDIVTWALRPKSVPRTFTVWCGSPLQGETLSAGAPSTPAGRTDAIASITTTTLRTRPSERVLRDMQWLLLKLICLRGCESISAPKRHHKRFLLTKFAQFSYSAAYPLSDPL